MFGANADSRPLFPEVEVEHAQAGVLKTAYIQPQR